MGALDFRRGMYFTQLAYILEKPSISPVPPGEPACYLPWKGTSSVVAVLATGLAPSVYRYLGAVPHGVLHSHFNVSRRR